MLKEHPVRILAVLWTLSWSMHSTIASTDPLFNSKHCRNHLLGRVHEEVKLSYKNNETEKLFKELNRVATLKKDQQMPSPCYEWNCTQPEYKEKNLLCRWCLPYAIIPGMHKSGTSELFALLESHPQVQGWKVKEIDVFCRWEFTTLADFEVKVSASLTSPTMTNTWWVDPYSYWIDGSAYCARDRSCANGLARYSPNTKSILMVRDPFQHLASLMSMVHQDYLKSTGLINRTSEEFREWVSGEAIRYLSRIRNHDCLRTLYYIQEMHRRSMELLIVDNYDLSQNREETILQLQSFLQIPNLSTYAAKQALGMNSFGGWGHDIKSNSTDSQGPVVYQFTERAYSYMKEVFHDYLCLIHEITGKPLHIVTPEPEGVI